MFNIMTKPADQIDVGDINELLSSQVPEGQQLEFKADLSGSSNKSSTAHDSQEDISNEAKKKILKEIVAFANAQGGTLLIGIQESSDKQRTAEKINPLPKCKDRADRFRDVFFSCIEPRIPQLEVFGVPVKGDCGVIVIRVGRSRLAPHCSRVGNSRDCYVRRADCSVPMTMWEIQDMTLNVSRGMERFERRLQKRSERFQQELNRLKTPNESFGIRLTALPVGEDILFDRVYHQHNIRNDLLSPWHNVCYKKDTRIQLECPYGLPPDFWRPVLRGVRGENHRNATDYHYFGYQELYCDGLLEMGYASCNSIGLDSADKTKKRHPLHLDPDWPFVLFANFIVWANHIRRKSSSPMAEYGIQVEILQKGRKVRLAKNDNARAAAFMHVLTHAQDERRLNETFPEISAQTFPDYKLEHEQSPEVLLNTFYRDFHNWLARPGEDTELEIVEK